MGYYKRGEKIKMLNMCDCVILTKEEYKDLKKNLEEDLVRKDSQLKDAWERIEMLREVISGDTSRRIKIEKEMEHKETVIAEYQNAAVSFSHSLDLLIEDIDTLPEKAVLRTIKNCLQDLKTHPCVIISKCLVRNKEEKEETKEGEKECRN
jgi:hypothetical protein